MPRKTVSARRTSVRPPAFVLALASAVLLISSFPDFNQPWCAWIALVPWLRLLRGGQAQAAFWWSYAIGLAFFLGSIGWLVYVTVVGWLILCAYLALFFGLFGLFARRVLQCRVSGVGCQVWLASAWVVLEYARSHVLSGFGWNLLAYSHTSYQPLIQAADLTGAWGVSFLIVLVNAALEQAFVRRGAWREAFVPLLLAAGTLAAVLGYGQWRLARPAGGPSVRVAVVQGNIPQAQKWDAAYRDAIRARYAALTQAAAAAQPDLIVWPETSTPGFFGTDADVTAWVEELARTAQRPLLVGTPTWTFRVSSPEMRNSAVLLDEQGTMRQQHDKLHLVPFGEFIPFERSLPWLRDALPPIGDFAPGDTDTVFQSGSGFRQDPELRFSVLICFEDIFPQIARRFVAEGARLLLVITNDAWFGPTAAAYQHAQASTFRAVELRTPVARAANTGWSGCIDATGRWTASVRDPVGRELFVDGVTVCDLAVNAGPTVYWRLGDWLVGLALLGVVWGLVAKKE